VNFVLFLFNVYAKSLPKPVQKLQTTTARAPPVPPPPLAVSLPTSRHPPPPAYPPSPQLRNSSYKLPTGSLLQQGTHVLSVSRGENAPAVAAATTVAHQLTSRSGERESTELSTAKAKRTVTRSADEAMVTKAQYNQSFLFPQSHYFYYFAHDLLCVIIVLCHRIFFRSACHQRNNHKKTIRLILRQRHRLQLLFLLLPALLLLHQNQRYFFIFEE
jgi:hypothetical protein